MAAASAGKSVSPSASTGVFDLRSATLSLVAVVLKTSDTAVLAAELEQRVVDAPGIFTGDPVVLDLSALPEDAADPDFSALLETLRRFRLNPIAAKGGTEAQMAAALEAGLIEAPAAPGAREGRKGKGKEGGEAVPEPKVVVREVVKEVIKEVVREVPGPGAPTLLIDRPLRSGQQVYARGGDLVVMAVVNFGAEVIADGNIHVYAPLRGKAIAGAKGNTEARIYTTCLEAELLSIAGTYRTSETDLPAEVRGKPAQIRLQGEKLVMEPLVR